MRKTIGQRTRECKEFRTLFAQSLPEVGARLAVEYPILQVIQGKTVGAGTRVLSVEFTEPLRLVVEQFCSKESDLVDSLAFFPHYDTDGTLKYVDHPDRAGFADPVALAEHCIKWLIASASE